MTLGDAPIEAEHRARMVAIARTIDEILNAGAKGQDRTTGFVLVVFPFGGGDGHCNYISNGADRKEIAALMREMMRLVEGQPEVEGKA